MCKKEIYAGVEVTPENQLLPIDGRYCNWQVNTSLPDGFEDKVDFFEFQKTLSLKCDDNSQPAVFTWTPDSNTPNNLYYQCFTHRWLGWKVRVVDSCDHLTSASIQEDYFISRIKPIFKINKENQIHYVERASKQQQSWNKNSPLQNQQINKIKHKIRKNQNVKFIQVKPTSIATPIAFESTRIRTPLSMSAQIFKEDAIHKNSAGTLGFSKVDKLPKQQIKELQFIAKNMSIIPTIQDRQLISTIIKRPVLQASPRRISMNRGRPRAKQIMDNSVTYVNQKIPLPPLTSYHQLKPLKGNLLKQAQKQLDLDQINLQGGFLPIFIDGNYGQALKLRKDKKLQVTLPLHLPINMPINLPLNLAFNENELNSEPISLALKKEDDSMATSTISSLIIPQTKRIISYLSTNQERPISTSNLNTKFELNSQPVTVNLKVPTTLKIPRLPTTANPTYISSLHPFTVKQLIKQQQHNDHNERIITTLKPFKSNRLSRLTIKSTTRPITTTSSTTTTTTTPPTTTSTTTTTTTTPASTTKKEIYAANFDPINFGSLSSSSFYHSIHVNPPPKKQQQLDNNKSQNKLSNHQLGLIDYNKPQIARASSTRVSVTKYQPNLTSTNQVDDAILSHVLQIISANETPPEINLNKRNINSRKPLRPKEDDLNNVNYFDNGYDIELHEKINK